MEHPGRGRGRNRFHMAVAIGSIAVAAAAACTSRSTGESSPPASLVLRIGVAQVSTTSPGAGLRGLSQNLTVEPVLRPDLEGRMQPILTDRWTVSNNGVAVTLHIRSGVKFHDGSPLDPSSLAAALPDAMRPLMGPLIDDVVSVR